MVTYQNAEIAFVKTFYDLLTYGIKKTNTRYLPGVSFKIENPLDNEIDVLWRNWSLKYAKREWNWYLSGDPNAEDIAKFAPIWRQHMDPDGNVMSNYGWQWKRNRQLKKVVTLLQKDLTTRRAVVSIYDGKEINKYRYDTPCTIALQFLYNPETDALDMIVSMRSNDIWYGFCNDQYQFSNLLSLVCEAVGLKPGAYYHNVGDMHLYYECYKKWQDYIDGVNDEYVQSAGLQH